MGPQLQRPGPKGTITVNHTLHGGTYPAGGGTQDRVTVNYQYQLY
ncbi:hypothetical protein [Streptosporangium sp. NPDC001681]